ncbi:hypothetical protein ACFL1R_03925 [Candidatus Latescibacterota bacterium]
MEISNTDDWYEIIDELNTRLEEIFNECYDSRTCELMLPKLRQKVREFIVDLEHEKETIEFIKMDM